MRIRAASTVDARSVAEIQVASSRRAYHGLLPDEQLAALSVEGRQAVWEELIGSAEVAPAVMVAEESTSVGFVHICPSRDNDASSSTGEIASLYVIPESWGHGVGTKLMESALTWFREHAFRSATLWVLSDNARGRRFYEARGWLPDGLEIAIERGDKGLVELRYRFDL